MALILRVANTAFGCRNLSGRPCHAHLENDALGDLPVLAALVSSLRLKFIVDFTRTDHVLARYTCTRLKTP